MLFSKFGQQLCVSAFCAGELTGSEVGIAGVAAALLDMKRMTASAAEVTKAIQGAQWQTPCHMSWLTFVDVVEVGRPDTITVGKPFPGCGGDYPRCEELQGARSHIPILA